MLEIETGKEAFIPKDLGMDTYPYSMRYYDPILAIIQEQIDETSRYHINAKN